MDHKKLKGKNVLITGASGFVGSHLENALLSLGANVYGTVTHKVKKNNHIALDIVDYYSLEKIVRTKKIQICFHLAAESLVEAGQEHPYKTFKTNFLGTLNILEIARKFKLERIIIASTSHVYGDNKAPYFEDFTPRPSRPYETSKACADLIAQSYAESFSLPVLIPRFVNIYGPGDMNFTRLIPKSIKSLFDSSTIELWGGDVVRQYIFIEDAVKAYLDLATVDIKQIKGNRIFNFGTNDKFKVKEIISHLVKLSGKKIKIAMTKKERKSEIKSQYVSWKKAKDILGWEPKVSFEKGLIRTFEWYSNYYK